MKKIIAVCPADDNNWEKFGKNLLTSLRKFHSEEELPFIRVNNPNPNDTIWWYRAAPILATEYLNEYETVIKLDADQIILAPLTDILNDVDEYDVGVVLNDQTYPINVWDITHPTYFNNGLVVLKSKEFAEHWLRLCYTEHFNRMQFREQDVLNILCSDYHNYKVKCFDTLAKVYGEVGKPRWTECVMDGDKVMMGHTQLCVIHFGGGAGDPGKGNYRIKFQEDVVKKIKELIK